MWAWPCPRTLRGATRSAFTFICCEESGGTGRGGNGGERGDPDAVVVSRDRQPNLVYASEAGERCKWHRVAGRSAGSFVFSEANGGVGIEAAGGGRGCNLILALITTKLISNSQKRGGKKKILPESRF